MGLRRVHASSRTDALLRLRRRRASPHLDAPRRSTRRRRNRPRCRSWPGTSLPHGRPRNSSPSEPGSRDVLAGDPTAADARSLANLDRELEASASRRSKRPATDDARRSRRGAGSSAVAGPTARRPNATRPRPRSASPGWSRSGTSAAPHPDGPKRTPRKSLAIAPSSTNSTRAPTHANAPTSTRRPLGTSRTRSALDRRLATSGPPGTARCTCVERYRARHGVNDPGERSALADPTTGPPLGTRQSESSIARSALLGRGDIGRER